MKTKLSNKELNELFEWFGLSDKEIHITLEDDIKGNMDKYCDEHLEHEKKKEFIRLFKECYSDIVKIMEFDPHKRVAVNVLRVWIYLNNMVNLRRNKGIKN